MSTTLVVIALLAQQPNFSVVVSRRSGVNQDRTAEIAALLSAQVPAQGLVPRPKPEDGTSCKGKKSCLVALARTKGLSVAAFLQVAKVLDDGVMSVELVSVDDDGDRLGFIDYEGPLTDDALKARFSQLLSSSKLRKQAPPAVASAPAPTPTPPAPPPAATPPPPAATPATPPSAALLPAPQVEAPASPAAPSGDSSAPRKRVATWVVGGLGVAALGAGIGMGAAASSASTTLRDGTVRSAETVQGLHDQARGLATGANVAYVGAGAALAAAVVLFFVEGR